MNENLHIIAEAGTNHNGSRETAKKLIDVAVKSHADSVKFQAIFPDGLYLPKLYKDGKTIDNDDYLKRMQNMLDAEDFIYLSEYANKKGIQFSASIFDRKGINLLTKLDAPYYKIASCDLNNRPFLREVAEIGKCIVLSTGMATISEIEKAVNEIFQTGNKNIVLMHCVSIYPSSLEQMNLSFIDVLIKYFGLPVGLSDHTEGYIAAAIAISKGATWIEKHFTLNRKQEGFDHNYAMEPDSFLKFVSNCKASKKACEIRIPKLQEEELSVKNRARRGVYASKDIEAGEFIKMSDILVVRPEASLDPNDVRKIISLKVVKKIHKYEPITWDKFYGTTE